MKSASTSVNISSTAWRRTAAALALTGGAAAGLAAGWIIWRGRGLQPPHLLRPCPALILGCRPGPCLSSRVRAAVSLYNLNVVTQLVFTGFGESEIAAQLARAQGVLAADIRVETKATDTWENMVLSAPLLGAGPCLLITDRMHLPRALVLARRAGLDAHPCPVDRPSRPIYAAKQLIREAVSVVKFVVSECSECSA